MQEFSFVEFHNRKDRIGYGPVMVTDTDDAQYVLERFGHEWTWTPLASYDMAAYNDRLNAEDDDFYFHSRGIVQDDPFYDPYPSLYDINF